MPRTAYTRTERETAESFSAASASGYTAADGNARAVVETDVHQEREVSMTSKVCERCTRSNIDPGALEMRSGLLLCCQCSRELDELLERMGQDVHDLDAIQDAMVPA